jgi:hypothetical protein
MLHTSKRFKIGESIRDGFGFSLDKLCQGPDFIQLHNTGVLTCYKIIDLFRGVSRVLEDQT